MKRFLLLIAITLLFWASSAHAMICLDNTDTLEGGASVTNVVDYTVHGFTGTTYVNLAQGQLSDTDPSVLYTATSDVSVVSVILVNTHSAAVTVNLYLDPENAGTPRRLIPEDLSLGIGYSLQFDGQRASVMDDSGGLVVSYPSTVIVSGASIADNAVVRGDGGGQGVQTSGVSIDDSNNVSTTGTVSATTAKLSDLTDTYFPYSNSGTLADSPLTTDGTDVANSGELVQNDIFTVNPDGTNEVFQVNDGSVDFTDGNTGTTGTLTVDSSGNWSYNKNVVSTGSLGGTTAKLSDLTDGYLPKHTSDATGFQNSILSESGTAHTLHGDNAAHVYAPSTSGDTSFWAGAVHDSEGDDDDVYQIGDGSTPGTNPFVTVDSTGNVGIGTAEPMDRLHLSAINPSLTLTDTGATGNNGNSYIQAFKPGTGWNSMNLKGHDFRFYFDGGSELIRFSSDGNVGIGTTVPGYELEVSGDGYFSGDVSALTFTDRTPFFEGDALAAIKGISGKDGQIDHATLPEFARRTLQRKETDTILGERVPVKPEDAWEEYTETETIYDKDEKGEKILLEMKTVYREKDGKIVAEQEPVYKSREVQVTKKRLKEDVKLDPATGELYTQESTQIEHVISEEPGRDIGAMVSILTRAVQQLTTRIEQLESAKIETP